MPDIVRGVCAAPMFSFLASLRLHVPTQFNMSLPCPAGLGL